MKLELIKKFVTPALETALLTKTGVVLTVTAAIAASIGLTTYIVNNNTDKEIFASKVITLNKIHNQYEISNVTGYKNCIKLNSEAACIKRMESISKHFANEYNSKLLKLVADEYGIDIIENNASGRQTAIGKKKTTADYIAGVFFSSLNVFKFDKLDYLAGKYSISFNTFDSRIPTLAEAYGMNEIKKGLDLIAAHELNNKFHKVTNTPENKYYHTLVSRDMQDLADNKDEVVSIGGKFAELGLNAQNEQFKEFDTKDLLRLMELEEAKNSGDTAIGKAPDLTDILVNSGKKFLNASVGVNNSQIYQAHVETPDLMKLLELEQAKDSGGNDSAVGKEKSWVEKTAEWSKDDYKKDNGGEK